MTPFQHISLIRITLLCIWTVILLLTPLPNLAYLPSEIAEGWGLSWWLFNSSTVKHILFNQFFLWSLKVIGVGLCLISMFSTNNKWSFPSAVIIVFIFDAILRSFNGFINHAQLASLYILVILAILPKVTYYPAHYFFKFPLRNGFEDSSLNDKAYWSDFVYIIRLVVIIPYTFIALNRFIGGRIDVFTGDALMVYITGTSLDYSNYGFSFFIEIMQRPFWSFALKLGFFLTTFFEAASIGVLLSSWFRRLWLIVLIAFHFVTLFAMNILFWENLVLIAVLFLIWSSDTSEQYTKQYGVLYRLKGIFVNNK